MGQHRKENSGMALGLETLIYNGVVLYPLHWGHLCEIRLKGTITLISQSLHSMLVLLSLYSSGISTVSRYVVIAAHRSLMSPIDFLHSGHS